jgi:lipopolysaccharide transport system permease protein
VTQPHEIVIKPPRAFCDISLRELWSYRDLTLAIAQRRVRTELQDKLFGIVWLFARPLLMVAVFTLFRNISAARPGVNIPYPLFLFCSLTLWFFFTETVTEVSSSLRANAGLITKVYFPRILLPIATLIARFRLLAPSIIPLVLFMLYFGVFPGWRIVLLPLVLLQLSLLILALGCLFAAAGLQSGDWEKVLNFSLYVGMFVSPVIFAAALVPPDYQVMFGLNPMVGTLEAARAALFDAEPWPQWQWYYSLGFAVVLAVWGLLAFQRAERNLADRL